MKEIIIIAILLSLSACAPMPGDKLLDGVVRAVPLEEVDVIVTISPWETQLYCTQYAPWYQIVINCIGNACLVPACFVATIKDGVIDRCWIYAWADIDFLVEHEKRHCQGYADLFY